MVCVEGTKIWYNVDTCDWDFSFRGVNFVHRGEAFRFPGAGKLDEVLMDIACLRDEMRRRLADPEGASQGLELDGEETILVSLDDLESSGTFEVEWSGGTTWGDLGVSFSIRNREIVGEDWVD